MSRAKPTIDQIQNLESELNSKQDNLVSGTNIKTINGSSVLGSGDLVIDTGITDHGTLTGLGDDDHTQYHNDTRGDLRYYTKTQLDSGQLDNRYYTETETNTLLNGKANTSHTHAISDVTNLQTTLDGKASATHTHVIGDVTGLQTTLDGKQATLVSGTNIKTINGTSILGAGDLVIGTGAQVEDQILNGVVDKAPSQNAVYDALQLKSDTTHNHTGTYEPANANIQSHISNTSNPHGTTASQVGAYTTTQVDTLLNGKSDTTHNHTGTYEPIISKSLGYAKWNGTSWVFTDETYSLSTHTHNYLPLTGGDITGNLSVSGDLTVGDTVNPTGIKAYIKSASSGRAWNPNQNLDLVIESAGIAGINIIGGNVNEQRIYFSDTDREAIGAIIYNHSDDTLKLLSNTTTSLISNNAGHILIPPTYNLTTTQLPNLYIDPNGKLYRSTATTILKTTATQASTTTTVVDITQLSTFEMAANSTYEVDCFITFKSAATTTGASIGFAAPPGAICNLEVVVPITSTAVASQLRTVFPSGTSTNIGNVVGTGVTAINSNHTARISGLVSTSSTLGLLQIRFATEVAGSAVTIQSGSILMIRMV